MGERSDVFVRIRAKENKTDKTYKHTAFFGLYYHWCYGERMISRLRGAIDFIHSKIDTWNPEFVESKERIDNFKKFWQVNFDMEDILDTTDLVAEAISDLKDGWGNTKADIFNQAENHGYIYLDITIDDRDNEKSTVKYAFVKDEYKDDEKGLPPVMSVEQFADWDIGDGERKWYEPDPFWDKEENKRWGKTHKKNFLKNVVPYTKKNIKEIEKSASVMTEDERNEFVAWGRSYVRKILRDADKEKKENLKKRETLLSEIYEKFHSYEQGYKDLLELVNKVYPEPMKK